MVLYSRGLRGRPAGQTVVAEVEDAIDVYFKSSSTSSPGDDVTHDVIKVGQKDYTWLQASSGRVSNSSRSRPVIPPLLELHLIQLGNKLTIGEAEVARARFRRAVSVAPLGPLSPGLPNPDYLSSTSCTDPDGNTLQSRATPGGHQGGGGGSAPVPRARCCNCPESGDAATDVVVDQLVRMMRKVILDIMDDNATTTLLRSRVSRQRLSASVRDDRIRSSSSSSLSSSCSSSSSLSSSVSKVAVITPANEPVNSNAPPEVPAMAECHSAASTPTCSSPSSLFSSPSSSSSSAGEKRREGDGTAATDLLRLPSPCNNNNNNNNNNNSINNEEEESSAFGGLTAEAAVVSAVSPPTPSSSSSTSSSSSSSSSRISSSSEIKHIEPIFLRCPKRVEENLAASHSFVRSREGGVVPSLRGAVSPRPKKASQNNAGDELQMRLNAILHTSRRDGFDKSGKGMGSSPRASVDYRLEDCQMPSSPSPLITHSPSSSYHYQISVDRGADSTKSFENGDTPLSLYEEVSSHPFSLNCETMGDHPSSPTLQSPSSGAAPYSGGIPGGGGGGGEVGGGVGGGGGGGGGGGERVRVGGNQGVGIPPHPPGTHLESHSTWRDPEDELQRTCGPMYAKPPRYSIFTISGTLTDPFGTNAKYSLRSLSTAHF